METPAMDNSRNKPLEPRDGHTLQVAIVARVSACVNQNKVTLEDQIDHCKEEIEARFAYRGPVNHHEISTKAPGARSDRVELQELEDQIRNDHLDLIVVEDLGRIVRSPAAVVFCGIAIEHGVRILSSNDGIDSDVR
jgi:site-specific DNA recombinase